jgi:hypothetical protein
MKNKTVKFPNGKTYTYTKYNSSDYWERTVGPENARRKIRLHQDIKTNGKGETLFGKDNDVHHKDGNKNNNGKDNLSSISHEKHTAVGKNAFKGKVKKHLRRQ